MKEDLRLFLLITVGSIVLALALVGAVSLGIEYIRFF